MAHGYYIIRQTQNVTKVGTLYLPSELYTHRSYSSLTTRDKSTANPIVLSRYRTLIYMQVRFHRHQLLCMTFFHSMSCVYLNLEFSLETSPFMSYSDSQASFWTLTPTAHLKEYMACGTNWHFCTEVVYFRLAYSTCRVLKATLISTEL